MRDARYEPSQSDIAQLIAILKHPGYEILMRVFESEIDQMQVDMINADPLNEKEVLAKHNLALASGMFFQRVINRIKFETDRFNNIQERGKIYSDPTETLLR